MIPDNAHWPGACLEHVVDEISDFLDARYVGAPEAVWRIFEYSLQGKSHAVERLPVHLPLHQQVAWGICGIQLN